MSVVKDVFIEINPSYPVGTTGLGLPVIFVAGAQEGFKEYKSLVGLQPDFGTETEVYKMAAVLLEQVNRPSRFYVATYVKGESADGSGVLATLKKYYNKPWHFAMLAGGEASEKLAMVTYIAEQGFKSASLRVSTKEEATPLVVGKRSHVFLTSKADAYPEAAVLGSVATLTVGNATWHDREVKDVPPEELTQEEADLLVENGINVIVEKAGRNVVHGGVTLDGEYIDFYHGLDWIKANVETDLQTALIENLKIPGNVNGVSLITSVITATLTTGGSQGIIDVNEAGQYDFSVSAQAFEDGTPENIAKRIYAGSGFRYKPQNAIHTIYVNGEVQKSEVER